MTHTKTKQQPNLSVRKSGYWRNRFRVDRLNRELIEQLAWHHRPNQIDMPHEWLAGKGYPSRELAEEYGAHCIRANTPFVNLCGFRYLGPQFFPEEGEQ